MATRPFLARNLSSGNPREMLRRRRNHEEREILRLLKRALWRNPLLFDRLDLVDQLHILSLRQHFTNVLFVLARREQLAVDVVGLFCEFADGTVKPDARNIQRRLAWLNVLIDHLHELLAFL